MQWSPQTVNTLSMLSPSSYYSLSHTAQLFSRPEVPPKACLTFPNIIILHRTVISLTSSHQGAGSPIDGRYDNLQNVTHYFIKFTDTNKNQASGLQPLHTATWNRVSTTPYQDCRLLIYDVTHTFQAERARSSEISKCPYMCVCVFLTTLSVARSAQLSMFNE